MVDCARFRAAPKAATRSALEQWPPAASGHWLPLQSEVPGLRNTKPPLLFWQGIVSTDHGRAWALWNLRYPCVIYTLLTATMVFLLAWKCSRSLVHGVVGALAYLAFYSTYRYGRPFLTNSPETFWLTLPFSILLFWKEAWSARWLPPLLGMFVGLGLLYKSFALVIPVGLGLCGWFLHRRDYRIGEFLRADAWKLIVIIGVSLGMFASWFALDPNPESVWSEFVMHENAGKFAAPSYLGQLLWGGSSIWTMILGVPANAGLLALPVAAMMGEAIRNRRRLSEHEKLLWIWLLALIVAFSLPSQRSARYLITAMPALAVLCALTWDRLGRGWFVATLAVCLMGLALLAYEAFELRQAIAPGDLYSVLYWLLLLAASGFCLWAMWIPALTRPGSPVAVLLVFLAMAGFLLPFDGARGHFSAEALREVAGRDVWVPSDFQASYEGYRFMLPTARIRSYPATHDQNAEELARRYPLFTVRAPLGAAACSDCRVLGERLDLRGRLSAADIRAILRGAIFQTVFLKEMLVASTMPIERGIK